MKTQKTQNWEGREVLVKGMNMFWIILYEEIYKN